MAPGLTAERQQLPAPTGQTSVWEESCPGGRTRRDRKGQARTCPGGAGAARPTDEPEGDAPGVTEPPQAVPGAGAGGLKEGQARRELGPQGGWGREKRGGRGSNQGQGDREQGVSSLSLKACKEGRRPKL